MYTIPLLEGEGEKRWGKDTVFSMYCLLTNLRDRIKEP
jgi:hypothetical protein